MPSHRSLIACGWIAALVWSCGSNLHSSAHAAGPPKDWKVSDSFFFSVDVYARAAGSDKPSAGAEEPKPSASYTMAAALLRVFPFEECGCWKLQFGSFSKLPEYKDVYRLWIDKQNGHSRKASRFRDAKDTPLPPASIATIILDAPPGYPIELIPDMESATIPTPKAGTTLEITCRAIEGGSERKAILRVNGQVEIEVREHWPAGAKWWSEYERFQRGHRELHAHLITPKTKPAPAPAAGSAPRSPAAAPPPVPPAESGLRTDSRLQVRITADFQHRPLKEVLDLLSRETKATLQMEHSLAATVPQVGSFSLLHVPAWKVMDRIVRDFVVDGRWDKTSAGYELSASRAMSPTVSPKRASQRSWLLFLIFAPLVLLSILYYYRNRQRRSLPPASSPD